MNRIKVLQIGKYYHPYIGGTELHLFTLVNELRKRDNLQIDILVSNTKPKTEIETDNGFKIIRLANIVNLFSSPLSLNMPFWIKRQKADILHFHLPNPLSILSYFLSRPKGKIIVSYHSDIVRQRFLALLFNPFLIQFLKEASCIIVSSENIVRNSSILNKFKEKCKVIPYGIDLSRFNPDREVIKKADEIKQKYGSPLILFVGRLVYYKGVEFLLAAMKDINAKLLVVGEGPLKKKLMRLSQKLNVGDKVFWLEKVDDETLVSFYYACDVFVLPSSIRAESFGIVQVEAFACRKPVVSTALPTGVPFVNVNGKTGITVPPRNSGALTQAINRLLNLSRLRENYGRNAEERAKSEFNKDRMAKEVFNLYAAYMDKNPQGIKVHTR